VDAWVGVVVASGGDTVVWLDERAVCLVAGVALVQPPNATAATTAAAPAKPLRPDTGAPYRGPALSGAFLAEWRGITHHSTKGQALA